MKMLHSGNKSSETSVVLKTFEIQANDIEHLVMEAGMDKVLVFKDRDPTIFKALGLTFTLANLVAKFSTRGFNPFFTLAKDKQFTQQLTKLLQALKGMGLPGRTASEIIKSLASTVLRAHVFIERKLGLFLRMRNIFNDVKDSTEKLSSIMSENLTMDVFEFEQIKQLKSSFPIAVKEYADCRGETRAAVAGASLLGIISNEIPVSNIPEIIACPHFTTSLFQIHSTDGKEIKDMCSQILEPLVISLSEYETIHGFIENII